MNESESNRVTPVLERLLSNRNEEDKKRVAMGMLPSTAPMETEEGDTMDIGQDDLSSSRRRSTARDRSSSRTQSNDIARSNTKTRRTWRDRKRKEA